MAGRAAGGNLNRLPPLSPLTHVQAPISSQSECEKWMPQAKLHNVLEVLIYLSISPDIY